MRLMLSCVCVLLLGACQTTSLQGGANIGYEKYLKAGNHKAFAVVQTSDGGYAWSFVSERQTRRQAYNEAKEYCKESGKKYAFGECDIYDVDGIRLADLKPAEIEAILNETSHATTLTSRDMVMTFSGVWENVSTSVTGTFVANKGQGRGPLSIEINGASCSGFWQYVRGKYQTKTLPEGTWSAVCDNNMAASGTYRSFKEGYGLAKGTDASGNAINLFYTPKKSDVEA